MSICSTSSACDAEGGIDTERQARKPKEAFRTVDIGPSVSVNLVLAHNGMYLNHPIGLPPHAQFNCLIVCTALTVDLNRITMIDEIVFS